jgi:hypothetical protein
MFFIKKDQEPEQITNGIELSIVIDALEEKDYSREVIKDLLFSVCNTPHLSNNVEGYCIRIYNGKIVIVDLL